MKNKQSTLVSKLQLSLLAIASSLLVANTANAEGTIVGKVGTLGGGLEYVHPITSKFAVGIGINGLSLSESFEDTDVNYDADLNIHNFSIIGDYHPFANGFRLSAGITNNGNEFELKAQPAADESIEINGVSYNVGETIESLDGTIGFESIAPYIGIGWGHAPKSGKGWSFDADLGVLFQGSPEVSLSANCIATIPTAVGAVDPCATLTNDIAAEEASLVSDSEEFDMYPVMSVGVSYTF